jgi:farnesyl diphosphate synthase
MNSDISDSYSIIKSTLLEATKFVSCDSLQIEEAIRRFKKLLDYNFQGSHHTGNTIISTFRAIKENQGIEVIDQELLLCLHGLSWCNQVGQVAHLMSDDIMDFSEKRYGKKCWHRLSEIGSTAINDVIILHNIAYMLLHKMVKKHPNYSLIKDLIILMSHNICIGQILDNNAGPINSWNIKLYNTIVDFKAGYPLSHLVRQGLLMAGVKHQSIHEGLEEILLDIGILVQIQNDYLDVYGKKHKRASDIVNGKCTWLIIRALEKSDKGQKKLLIDNYGADVLESVEVVKSVFEELDLRQEYLDFESKQLQFTKQKCELFIEKSKNSREFGQKGFPSQIFQYLFAVLEARSARENKKPSS